GPRPCARPAGDAGTECRASAGDCDVAESCNGSSTTCPANAFQPVTHECRGTAGECGPAETCTGSSATCPTDAKKAADTTCTDDGNVCSRDVCDRSGNACTPPAANARTECGARA